MFYPVQVLCYRHKGKLAPCWLAVTNEKLFKKYYKSVAIKKIDVAETVEMILLALPKFSLYLSAQLICGITKIFSYQVMYYEKEILDIYKVFEFTALPKRTEEQFDAIRNLDSAASFELSLTTQKFLNLQINEDLHILPEIPSGIIQDAMYLNFGNLTDEELDLMNNGDITFELRTKMHIVDDNTLENVTEVVEEHRQMQSPRMVPSPVIVDISERRTELEEETFLIPQKRQLHQTRAETPIKKKRLSENATMVNISPKSVPLPDTELCIKDTSALISADPLPAVEIRTPISLQHTDKDMESVQAIFDTFAIKKKTKMHIDKRTILEKKMFVQQLQNKNIACKELVIPQINSVQLHSSATNLFNRPCMKWGTSLRPFFTRHITGQFRALDENITFTKPIQSEEIVRGPQKTVDEYSGQISKLIEHSKQTIVEESSAIKIQDVCIPEDIPYQETKMDNPDDTLEDIEDLLKNRQVPSTPKYQTPEFSIRSTPESHNVPVSSHDILAILEALWDKQPYVKFSSLVSVETYAREDAATIFCILLDFHARKKLILCQANFCKTLWIRKYENWD